MSAALFDLPPAATVKHHACEGLGHPFVTHNPWHGELWCQCGTKREGGHPEQPDEVIVAGLEKLNAELIRLRYRDSSCLICCTHKPTCGCYAALDTEAAS